MADRVAFHIVFENQRLNEDCLRDVFEGLLFFDPTDMSATKLTKSKRQRYSKATFEAGFAKELTGGERINITLSDELSNTLEVSQGKYYSSLLGTLSYELFEKYKVKFLDNLDLFFIKYSGSSGFCCSLEDNFFQNTKDVSSYHAKGKPTDDLKIVQSPIFKNKQIIDIEFNPGHSHFVNDQWFGSCWRMWFGKEYYQYIPKEAILSFKDGLELFELENGSVRVTLYEDIWAYDKPENRAVQWKFRRIVGVDEVAHQLQGQPIEVENPDPAIEIFTENLQHGGVRGITYYYNKDKVVVPKSKSTESYSYEIDQHGAIVWSETKKL